jgi:geranylgeranyl diphosphate synthase type I
VGEALARYGDAVGLAFQMRDDVLGLFGDPEVTGKGRLDDLREGKRTVLVTRALALAPATDRKVLADALGDPALDEAAGARCREVVASSGALASVEALIAAQHALALHALDGLYEPARAALAQLAGLATRRWQ